MLQLFIVYKVGIPVGESTSTEETALPIQSSIYCTLDTIMLVRYPQPRNLTRSYLKHDILIRAGQIAHYGLVAEVIPGRSKRGLNSRRLTMNSI
jgi:hypothetical protein